MARHLVTGGAGFIGSALVRRLLDEGHIVNVLDDFSRGDAHRLRGLEVEVVSADIRNRDQVDWAVSNADVVWHLAYVGAPQNFEHDPKVIWDIAVNGMANVLYACEVHGGKELFVISSSEAYQQQPEGMTPTPETVPLSVPDVLNPRASYGGGKIISELGTIAYSLSGVLKRAIVIRPHNIIGPDMGRDHVIPQFALRLKETIAQQPAGLIEFPIQGTGLESRTFLFIDDLVDAFLLLYARGEDRGIYHVGSMEEKTIAAVAHAVADCFEREIHLVPLHWKPVGANRRCPDITKMRALGFEPKVGFEMAVARTVEWYAAN